MSWTEVNHREGLPYGGLPYDALLHKLEETDPELVDEVRGHDSFHAIEDEYDDYARSEIIDWSPDKPFLESDQTRRDPGLSRSILNLRYNGTRGSHHELPRHPELFVGFTGNDPRGVDNVPRFDQMRGHMTARAANLTVSMGENNDHHEAERPWTGQAISYAMKEVHRRLKKSTRIFTAQKEGRPWGRNVVADGFAAGDIRSSVMGAGTESLPSDGERFVAGDHMPADGLSADGVRGLGVPEDMGTPWRRTTGEADLGVQQYGQKRGAGRTTIGPNADGGARRNATASDQDWEESRDARGTNRQVLGATMALAARSRRAVKSGAHDQDPGLSFEATGTPGGGIIPGHEVGRVYYSQREDQTRRPGTEVQDDEGGMLGSGAGLTPAAHPEHAIRASESEAAPNSHLTNVESIVTGLREGTAASRRRIAGMVVADGARPSVASEAPTRRGAIPSSDNSRVTRMSEMPLQLSAAAGGLEVHTYGSAPPTRPEQRAALGRDAYDAATWDYSREAMPIGMSRAPEWRSATQGQHVLGDTPDRVFGFDAEDNGSHGSAPTGPKSLRPGGWSDSAGLTDEIRSFGDDSA